MSAAELTLDLGDLPLDPLARLLLLALRQLGRGLTLSHQPVALQFGTPTWLIT